MKTEAKAVGHTAGPWHLRGDTVLVTPRLQIAQMDRCNKHPDTAKANARLIAAAPELLEACRAVLESEESTLGDGGSVIGDQYRSLIQAAIDKAEGRQ